mmetsp:Transcript_24596/g.38200  ORF Transcript_24596/g.38200 Transcript_24596/m.38200 type:complete len:94 (-) Transcript_24596:3673-3954(-)
MNDINVTFFSGTKELKFDPESSHTSLEGMGSYAKPGETLYALFEPIADQLEDGVTEAYASTWTYVQPGAADQKTEQYAGIALKPNATQYNIDS